MDGRGALRVVQPGQADEWSFDEQWDRFWAATAERMTRAITAVSPEHPQVGLMRSAVRDARAAAGLPPAWS